MVASPANTDLRTRSDNRDEVLQQLFVPFDVFVSHASEDKADLVRPLVQKLETEFKLRVWYDELRLRPGDSLTDQINRELAESLFGVVVFSRSFLKKPWPQRELQGLSQLSVNKTGRILPIWHKVSQEEVVQRYPMFADLVAIRSEIGITEVARVIAGRVCEI